MLGQGGSSNDQTTHIAEKGDAANKSSSGLSIIHTGFELPAHETIYFVIQKTFGKMKSCWQF